MKRILVVSLSPALDRSYSLKRLSPGKIHRVGNPKISPGGKAINVARVLSILQKEEAVETGKAEVSVLGFFAGRAGDFILEDLKLRGIETHPIFLKGETRSSINLIDSDGHTETEILEKGPRVKPEKLAELKDKLTSILKDEGKDVFLVLSGSLPDGADKNTYKDLIDLSHTYGAKIFLDSSGTALAQALHAAPFFAKPNLKEFADLSGLSHQEIAAMSTDELAGRVDKIRQEYGLSFLCLTMGSKGALLASSKSLLYADSPRVELINSIGSGDSFTAGFTFALARGKSESDALKLAVACGASNAKFPQVGYVDLRDIEALSQEIKIETLFK